MVGNISRAKNLFGLSHNEIRALARALGEPDFRARQIYSWLYNKRVRATCEMSDLTRETRLRLAETYTIDWPEIALRQESRDGTIKYLLRLRDGLHVESVFIPETARRTTCLSTQAGCALRCAFCLTGHGGFLRNLTTGEILGQLAVIMRDTPAREMGSNVVMMGMGEPLLNEDAVMAALRILMDPEGFAIPPRKLTLSTVGILPALERLMAEPLRPNLAISLHAPTSALRAELMPIEKKYALSDVVAAAARYPVPSGGRVTYEYVLLKGVNDNRAHARGLVRLLGRQSAKINLIPLNPAPGLPYEAPTKESVATFVEVLRAARIAVSVRKPRGQDIQAACGQLHCDARAEKSE
ncbi:MAG: 23S rRNA (adenine(2503)-C(2))-methyltransferase RlmN [Vicinamibacteria bacterium]|jgi:23S rRNA (adenine2503-C2)-methyltransferase|nr:23S rRNA (adenine(2503)-C(2))-methyltransferase RlmN [Vicinamibacteria bacterium]